MELLKAMSPFFTDFVPHIYIEGKKLWQKEIYWY